MNDYNGLIESLDSLQYEGAGIAAVAENARVAIRQLQAEFRAMEDAFRVQGTLYKAQQRVNSRLEAKIVIVEAECEKLKEDIAEIELHYDRVFSHLTHAMTERNLLLLKFRKVLSSTMTSVQINNLIADALRIEE